MNEAREVVWGNSILSRRISKYKIPESLVVLIYLEFQMEFPNLSFIFFNYSVQSMRMSYILAHGIFSLSQSVPIVQGNNQIL